MIKYFGYRLVANPVSNLAKEYLHRLNSLIPFVQVGANDGARFDDLHTTVTSSRLKGKVLLPIPETFERLSVNYRRNSLVTPINVAIHPSKSTEIVYHARLEALNDYVDWVQGIASMEK